MKNYYHQKQIYSAAQTIKEYVIETTNIPKESEICLKWKK